MVQSTFEEGVLHRNGTVRLAGPISAVKVLATVQAVLASRIDRLAPAEKELLQTLAEKLNSAKLPQVTCTTIAKRYHGRQSKPTGPSATSLASGFLEQGRPEVTRTQ